MFDAQVTFADGSNRVLQVSAADETGAIFAVLEQLLHEHAASVARGVSPGEVDRPRVVRVAVLGEGDGQKTADEIVRDTVAEHRRQEREAPVEKRCGTCATGSGCRLIRPFAVWGQDTSNLPPWENCRFWKPRTGKE